MKFLGGVQTLRAWAALAVVVFHASSRAGDAILVGQAGVDVFFVVSGFIMWVLSERSPAPRDFMRDRILRITPLYWLATAAMVLGGLIGAFPNLVLSPPYIFASFLFLPHPSPNGDEIWPILVQGWTLNYEMFFYALFALVLFARRASQLPLLLGAMLILVGAGRLFGAGNFVSAFYTDPILLEFAAGVLIGAFWTRGVVPNAAVAAAMILAGMAAYALQAVAPLEGERVVMYGAPAVLIVGGVVALERRGRMAVWPPLRFLGDASYSIYLFHTFAISVVGRLLGEMLPYWVETVVSTVAGALAGVIVFVLIERPLMRYFKSRRDGTAKEIAAEGAAS
ncbi:MAG: acyltransferase [Hyphomonadaceae bacterium]|nr:acyltransferase [Hyphomonadaceae bacterium]